MEVWNKCLKEIRCRHPVRLNSWFIISGFLFLRLLFGLMSFSGIFLTGNGLLFDVVAGSGSFVEVIARSGGHGGVPGGSWSFDDDTGGNRFFDDINGGNIFLDDITGGNGFLDDIIDQGERLTRVVEAKVADARVSRELVGRDKCQLKLINKYLFIAAMSNSYFDDKNRVSLFYKSFGFYFPLILETIWLFKEILM